MTSKRKGRRRAAIVAGGKNDWGTDPAFVAGVASWFGTFDVDVCADEHNHKAPIYFDIAQNGLRVSWLPHQVCWCNPPWGRGLIAPWVRKAIVETRRPDCRCAMLLPAKLEQPFWGLIWRHADAVLEVEGRMKFVGATSGVTCPVVLVLWDRDLGIGPRHGRIGRDGALVAFGGAG